MSNRVPHATVKPSTFTDDPYIVLDAETFYDTKGRYSLRTLSPVEYVSDSRFEELCWSVKLPGMNVAVLTPQQFAAFAKTVDWGKLTVVHHNAAFDATILARRYGVKPRRWFCTMNGSRAVLGGAVTGVGLDAVAKYLGLSGKLGGGAALQNVDGVRDLSPQQLGTLMAYAGVDSVLTEKLYLYLRDFMSDDERTILHWATAMYVHPKFMLDKPTLDAGISAEEERIAAAVDQVPVPKSVLRSGPKFAEVLRSLGIDPPTKKTSKFNKATNKREMKETFAFAKDDQAFIELGADPKVKPYIVAKLTVSSTQELARLERFAQYADRGEAFPIPLHASGAMTTHRLSGFAKLNLQNLGRDSACRSALRAPPGETLVIIDSAGIEMRIANALVGNWDVLERALRGEDEYSRFASVVYGRQITKADKEERTVGKVSVLSGNYGSGGGTYQKMLFNQTGIFKPLDFCSGIIRKYRDEYFRMPDYWDWGDRQLSTLCHGGRPEVFPHGAPLKWVDERMPDGDRLVGVQLPGGLIVKYWNLRYGAVDWGDGDKMGMLYTKRDKVIPGIGAVKSIWGGTFLENMSQALAREVVMHQMLEIYRRTGHLPLLHIHDEHIWSVPKADADVFFEMATQEMSGPISWWPQLITGCSGEISDHYIKP